MSELNVRSFAQRIQQLDDENTALKQANDDLNNSLLSEASTVDDLRAQVTACEAMEKNAEASYRKGLGECDKVIQGQQGEIADLTAQLAAMTQERDDLYNQLHVYKTVYGGD